MSCSVCKSIPLCINSVSQLKSKDEVYNGTLINRYPELELIFVFTAKCALQAEPGKEIVFLL